MSLQTAQDQDVDLPTSLAALRCNIIKRIPKSSRIQVAQALTHTTIVEVSLCRLVQLMLSGKVPDTVCPLLYGASLCALGKKAGGIRPIAVGSTFRRLTAKVCVRRVKERAVQLLSPGKFGFGVRNGCEIVSHTVRRFCAFPHTSSQIVCKVDFKNAFNSMRRDVFLDMVRNHFPEIYSFTFQCSTNVPISFLTATVA